jgi:hypothetical protein
VKRKVLYQFRGDYDRVDVGFKGIEDTVLGKAEDRSEVGVSASMLETRIGTEVNIAVRKATCKGQSILVEITVLDREETDGGA